MTLVFRTPAVLLILPVLAVLFIILRMVYPERSFIFPTDEVIKSFRGSIKIWAARRLIFLRVAAITCLVIALARPQIVNESTSKKEGIAMVLCIDCSSTMLAEDLQLGALGLTPLVGGSSGSKRLNRLDAVIKIARDFIESRSDDMIGIVAFAAQAYVICPPTFDKEWLLNSLKRVKIGLIKDGTAVGSGIMSSLDSLKNVKARGKAIILLTDGINNFGLVPPIIAAKAARSLGVKIYTVGIKSVGISPFPTVDVYGKKTYENVRIDIDEDTLKKIADLTGGNHYKVTSLKLLKESYADIDKLERVLLDESAESEQKDAFGSFLFWALVFIAMDIVLSNTILRRIP